MAQHDHRQTAPSSSLTWQAKAFTAAQIVFPGLIIAGPLLASDWPVATKVAAFAVPVAVRAAWVAWLMRKGRWLTGRTWRRQPEGANRPGERR